MTDDLAADVREALATLLLGILDTKQQLGYRYAEWCTSAPTLEAATAASAMAQAELGHSRAMAPLLDTFADLLPAESLAEERQVVRAAPGLEQPFASWTDYIAANVVTDGALTTIFETAVNSSYRPLQNRMRKMIEEERYHVAHGQGWTFKLVRVGGKPVELLCERIAVLLEETLNWIDSFNLDLLMRSDVLIAGREETRRRFLARIQPVLQACGLADEAVGR